MTLLRDGRDVRVSKDEAFLKDNGDLMVFCEQLDRLTCLQTAHCEVKNNGETELIL